MQTQAGFFDFLRSLGSGDGKRISKDELEEAIDEFHIADDSSSFAENSSEPQTPATSMNHPFFAEDTHEFDGGQTGEPAHPAPLPAESDPAPTSDDAAASPSSPVDYNVEKEAARKLFMPKTDEERMKAIEAEFGAYPVEEGSEPEKFIFDGISVVIRGVILRGRLFITNYRMLWYGLMPSEQGSAKGPLGVISKTAPEGAEGDIIRQSACTIHNQGFLGQAKTRWAVLRKDTISLYHESGTHQLYRPAAHLHLGNIIDVYEDSDENELKFSFYRTTKDGKREKVEAWSTFKTPELATAWRRELAKAVWDVKNTRERFRASIPWDRITSIERQSFYNYSELYTLSVNVSEDNRKDGEQRDFQLSIMPDAPQSKAFNQQSAKVPIKTKQPSPVPLFDIFDMDGEGNLSMDPVARSDTVNSVATAPGDEHESEPSKNERLCNGLNSHLNLTGDEAVFHAYHADVNHGLIPVKGALGLSRSHLLFEGTRTTRWSGTRMYIPFVDIKAIAQTHSMRLSVYSLKISIRAVGDVTFDLHSKHKRDDMIERIHEGAKRAQDKLDNRRGSASSDVVTSPKIVQGTPASETNGFDMEPISPTSSSIDKPLAARPQAGNATSKPARESSVLDKWVEATNNEQSQKSIPVELITMMPRPVNVGANTYSLEKHRFGLLTIGSRGDVQPYIALAQRLKAIGQDVVIIREWVESFDIEYKEAGGDPSLLMEVSVEHKIFDADTQNRFRSWLDDLLMEAYKGVKGCDVLIESPSTFAGVHVAESLKIPSFTMPWTKTTAFPHAFLSAGTEMSGAYNALTYTLFEEVLWRATAKQINRFRKKIGLESTSLNKLQTRKIPFVYNFSPFVCPKPLDWGDTIEVSGYWFLQTPPKSWDPPKDLVEFIKKARDDGRPIAYIGFGSITVSDPGAVTQAVVTAVKEANVRAILAKGWSSRGKGGKDHADKTEVPKEYIYQVDSIPHDWLFPQIDIALHHGGAGTTAASLREGLTTLIKPFFGDQTFWSQRVQKLGAGLRVASLSANDLSEALTKAASDTVMREKAQRVGEQLRREDGLAVAIGFIFQFLARAGLQRGATESKLVDLPKPHHSGTGSHGSAKSH